MSGERESWDVSGEREGLDVSGERERGRERGGGEGMCMGRERAGMCGLLLHFTSENWMSHAFNNMLI